MNENQADSASPLPVGSLSTNEFLARNFLLDRSLMRESEQVARVYHLNTFNCTITGFTLFVRTSRLINSRQDLMFII